MADGWGKRTKDREYIAFRNWLYNKYWWIRAVSPSDYKSSSYYPKWVALGRPGYVEAEEAETYEDKLTRYKEAVQSGQALSVRDYPDLDVILEPYEGAGWHWEQSSRDESGFPLLEPVWRRMPDEVTKPPITPGAPQIRSIGGYDYEYTITGYDEKGNPVYGWNLIGRTPEEGVSKKEQWEWQKRQAGLTREAEAAELKRRTLAGLEGPEDWISRWMYMNYPYQQQQKEPLTVLM